MVTSGLSNDSCPLWRDGMVITDNPSSTTITYTSMGTNTDYIIPVHASMWYNRKSYSTVKLVEQRNVKRILN